MTRLAVMAFWNRRALLLTFAVLLAAGFVLAMYFAGWPNGNPVPVVPFQSPS